MLSQFLLSLFYYPSTFINVRKGKISFINCTFSMHSRRKILQIMFMQTLYCTIEWNSIIYSFNLATGLLELIGSEVFRDIFGIRSREETAKTSLTFVIDAASSKADILMIIKAIEKIVNETKGSKFLPKRYVTVIFSDSGMLSFLKVFTYLPILCIFWFDSFQIQINFHNTKCLQLFSY